MGSKEPGCILLKTKVEDSQRENVRKEGKDPSKEHSSINTDDPERVNERRNEKDSRRRKSRINRIEPNRAKLLGSGEESE